MEGLQFEYSSGIRQMFEEHSHDEIEIYFLISGQRYYFINNETHLVLPRNLVLIRENLPHKVFSAGYGHFERYILYINRHILTRKLNISDSERIFDIFDGNKFVYRLDDAAIIESILHKMYVSGLENPNSLQKRELLLSLTAELLNKLADSIKNLDDSPSDISYVNKNMIQIADYINKNYSTKISLSFLAEKFSLSKYYLCKLFKKSIGFTFSDFLNNVRITEAKKMLETTDLKVAEIASKTGYNDIAYFSRVFKKNMGISPLKYRKSQIQS